jgi:hypothetical protein
MQVYLILGQAILAEYPDYRGTYRAAPSHVEGLSEDSEVNRAFRWYAGASGESGFVTDLASAKALVLAYASISPPRSLEIVRLVASADEVRPDERLLGFDVSMRGGQSLLSWGLDLTARFDRQVAEPRARLFLPLVRLTEEHFRPVLNRNLLFDGRETASFYQECMVALQKACPGLWESDAYLHDFAVTGVVALP